MGAEAHEQHTKESTVSDKRSSKSTLVTLDVTSTTADRAYDKFVARGLQHGHDVEDWLSSEREAQGTDVHRRAGGAQNQDPRTV